MKKKKEILKFLRRGGTLISENKKHVAYYRDKQYIIEERKDFGAKVYTKFKLKLLKKYKIYCKDFRFIYLNKEAFLKRLISGEKFTSPDLEDGSYVMFNPSYIDLEVNPFRQKFEDIDIAFSGMWGNMFWIPIKDK